MKTVMQSKNIYRNTPVVTTRHNKPNPEWNFVKHIIGPTTLSNIKVCVCVRQRQRERELICIHICDKLIGGASGLSLSDIQNTKLAGALDLRSTYSVHR